MANAMLGDHLHALVDGVIGSNGDDGAGHNFVNECVAGGSSLQNDLAGVVPLGGDPYKLAIGHHQKSAHGLFGHYGDSLIDGGGGLHRPDGTTFLLQNGKDCSRHRLPPCLSLKTVPKLSPTALALLGLTPSRQIPSLHLFDCNVEIGRASCRE